MVQAPEMDQAEAHDHEERARNQRDLVKTRGEAATLGLLVSIYLLLTAFFIVLNSISNQKVSRAGAALESVNNSFDKRFEPPARVIDFLRQPNVIAPNDEFVEEAAGLMASVFSLDAGSFTMGGDSVRVAVPIEMLFDDGSAVTREGLSPFVIQMSELVMASKTGERREVEFVFGNGSSELSSQPLQRQFLAARRAGNLAQSLVGLGLPPNAVSIGVAPGSDKVITVVFRIRDDEAARVSFSDFVGSGS